MDVKPEFVIACPEALAELYDAPLERSVKKQVDRLDDYCRAFIAASPLVIVGTQGPAMADNSPRGDVAGFVKVVDDHTLLIPDRRGNNRLDSLKNLATNPVIGLLFLVPGVNESFRVNGEALLSRDPELTSQFEVEGKAPKVVVVVRVKEAYVHCSRALVRADLWNPAKFQRAAVPSMGTILAAHTKGFVDAKTFDEDARVRVPATLY